MPRPINSFSGLLFLVPAALAAQKGMWGSVVATTYLATTSFLYHRYDTHALFWADQIGIAGIVGTAFSHTLNTGALGKSIYYGVCAYNTFIYWGGKQWNTMAFHPDQFIQDLFHSTIHLGSAICYSSLLLLLE
jgi:hypothetical protein